MVAILSIGDSRTCAIADQPALTFLEEAGVGPPSRFEGIHWGAPVLDANIVVSSGVVLASGESPLKRSMHMSRYLVLLFSGVTAAGAVTGVGAAQAQAYIDGGVAEIYVGDAVQVYVGNGWYAATVLQVSGGSVLVRYFDGSADEWVDASRLSLSGGGQGVGYQPAIQVYWGSQWYDGTLLATRGNRYHVRYRGTTEWVGADRWHHRGWSNRRPSVGRYDGGRHGYVGGGRHDGGSVRGDRHRGGNVRGNRHGGGGNRHGQVHGGSRGGGRDHGQRNRGGGHQGGGNNRRGGGGRH